MPANDLAQVLAAIDAEFGLVPGAEVTTEANPESVDPEYFERLLVAGLPASASGCRVRRPTFSQP